LTPKGTLRIACPPGVHRATYARLIREYNRLRANLDALPQRRLASRLRTAYQRQFENRIIRIRRALHLPTAHPPVRQWYRTGEAALYLGISPKTLIRWTDKGRIRCERPSDFASRRSYARTELARVRHSMKI